MSKNPYWNTLWTNRDEEFYWSGTRFGFALGIGVSLVAMLYVHVGVEMYKNHKEEKTES